MKKNTIAAAALVAFFSFTGSPTHAETAKDPLLENIMKRAQKLGRAATCKTACNQVTCRSRTVASLCVLLCAKRNMSQITNCLEKSKLFKGKSNNLEGIATGHLKAEKEMIKNWLKKVPG